MLPPRSQPSPSPRSRATGAIVDHVFGQYKYRRALDDLRWLLGQAGFGVGALAHLGAPSEYGMHSARRGGATMLLALGVPALTVMRIGHWVDPRSLRTYDARSIEVAMSVTLVFRGAHPAAATAVTASSRPRAPRK